MRKFIQFAVAALLVTALFGSNKAEASDQTQLLDSAARTIQNMKSDPAFDPIRGSLDRARAIFVVPSLVKGGFIFGAEGGNGVLMAKSGRGWSDPAFYTMGSASFGLQAGVEAAQVVLLVMSDRALQAIERDKFKIGAGAGLTVLTVGEAGEASTAGNLSGDIIAWSTGKGLYGGITLNGSVISARNEWNHDFYGRDVAATDILSGQVHSPQAEPLRQQLASIR